MQVSMYQKLSADLELVDISLPTLDEVAEGFSIIPRTECGYWTKTVAEKGGKGSYRCVYGGLEEDEMYSPGVGYPGYCRAGVRPVLSFHPGDCELEFGDVLEIAGHKWTVIGEDRAICNEILAEITFDRPYNQGNGTDYENSYVREWLYDFAAKNGIELSRVAVLEQLQGR